MKKIYIVLFLLVFLFCGSVCANDVTMQENNLISDIATLRCYSASFSETENKIDIVVDSKRVNLSKSTVGVAVIPKEGYSVEYEYVSDNGGEGSTTGFSSTNTSKYTLLSTGVDTENDGGGSAGTIPVKIFKRTNGTVMNVKVTIGNETFSKVYQMKIVVRDVAASGDVDIADIKPVRSKDDSCVVDNELKTVYLEAEKDADTCGFAVSVGNNLGVSRRPRRIITAQGGKKLGHGAISDDSKEVYDRYVVARKSAGLEQNFKVKVFGGEKGLTYCWYTVKVKFSGETSGDTEFADLLTVHADSCEFDDETNTIDVFYSGDYVAIAPIINSSDNLTTGEDSEAFKTVIDGTHAIGVYAKNGEKQTTQFTISSGEKTTVYTVNFYSETVE